MSEDRPLPGFNWIKFIAVLAVVLCATLSVVLALSLLLVSRTMSTVSKETARTSDLCVVVKAIDPIIVKAHDQTQRALDDGTIARLIAKGDLPPHYLADSEQSVKDYAAAHETLVTLTCG